MQFTLLNKNQFKIAFKLCLESTYFMYIGQIYSHIFRTAMETPISAVITNLVIEELENDILK